MLNTMQKFSEHIIFLRQLQRNFKYTGAIAPSSRFLAKMMVSEFSRHREPVLILEVGPGTGVITREIVKSLQPADELHICEINPIFARHIKRLFRRDKDFIPYKNQMKIFNQPVQNLNANIQYDYIISSLPLNNFNITLIREIQFYFESHIKPGGILSYFEYYGIRKMRLKLSTGPEKNRLMEINHEMNRFIRKYQMKFQVIPLNFPPACVRHLQF